ncbi:MAG: pht5 1 [Chloroflexi bacterium]|nr:pht5 1 [Chloroflexota bacterium]
MLRLSLACGDYDRTRALIERRVQPAGIDLDVVPLSNAWARHRRMVLNEEFDVCELSVSSFLMARDRGQQFVAIPVFPYRMFRHSYLWCATRAGIAGPSDLAGKRIGVGMYQITTALWLRGHLQHDYGVPPSDSLWITEMPELVPFDAPPGVRIEIGDGRSLEGMLLAGELDAFVGVEGIPPGFSDDERVHRIFGRDEEQAYFRRTGIFPIMHAIVFRAAILDQHPWAAVNVLEAFRQSKALGREYTRFPRVSSLAWAMSYQDDERAILGADPYPYTLDANRHAIETAIQYSSEQGLIRRAPTVDELFAPGTIDFPEHVAGAGGVVRAE